MCVFACLFSSDKADRQQQAAASAVLRTAWDGEDVDHPGVREEVVRRRFQDDGPGGGGSRLVCLAVSYDMCSVRGTPS